MVNLCQPQMLTMGEVDFHVTTWIGEPAIAKVQAEVRRRVLINFVRRGLIDKVDSEVMLLWRGAWLLKIN
jgi:hypothetical protein